MKFKKSGRNLSSPDSAHVFWVACYDGECGYHQSYRPPVSLNILTRKSPHQ
jgi:hypothetical protein